MYYPRERYVAPPPENPHLPDPLNPSKEPCFTTLLTRCKSDDIILQENIATMTGKCPAGHFRLLYFASAASFTGKSADDFPAPLPVADLFGLVEKKHPGIKEAVLSTAAITVNLDYIDVADGPQGLEDSKGRIINEGDEVAIIPPVSSG